LTTPASDVLLCETDPQGICTLTLNRPGQLNALNGPLVDALHDTFIALAYDPDVRVVILTGAGPKGFCAGADLKERAGMSPMQVRKRIDDYARCFAAIESLPKPVICAINGYAFGGGLELAMTADMRVMSSATKIGLTELKLGIIPGAGGTQRLPRLIGMARAKEMIFTAARIDSQRALDIGLINAHAPPEALLQTARELAERTLACAPIALAQAKVAINAGMQTDLATGLQIESRAYAVTIPTRDRLEGLAAFKEGRPPRFTAE
jgi:methylglutaconyl-CoA hydratase